MAEERLIDDDKDRKYKIRKNADGEEELVIDETSDGEEEETDISVFEVPVTESDDEDAAVLTPEQFAERKRRQEEEERARTGQTLSHLSAAREKIAAGDFEAALYEVNLAEELSPVDGEVACVKLMALSRNFTDFISLDECVSAAENVLMYADENQKSELKPFAASKEFKAQISETEEKTEELRAENEAKKAERREVFAEKKKSSVKFFAIAAATLTVLAIIAIVFASMIFSAENGIYIVLTAVFGALAAVALIFVLITAHKFWDASRNCKLNERDASTKLGREYIEIKTVLDKLNKINSVF